MGVCMRGEEGGEGQRWRPIALRSALARNTRGARASMHDAQAAWQGVWVALPFSFDWLDGFLHSVALCGCDSFAPRALGYLCLTPPLAHRHFFEDRSRARALCLLVTLRLPAHSLCMHHAE